MRGVRCSAVLRPMTSLFGKDRDLSAVPETVELAVRASDFQAPVQGFQLRLDQFLQRHLTWRSRTSLQRLVQDGFVAVAQPSPEQPLGSGAARVERRSGRRLFDGALVVVTIPEELRLDRLPSTSTDVDVLYEDDEVLVVDKPPGLPVHPSGRHLTDTLVQRVHARLAAQDAEPLWKPKLCHRLDVETSGLVLLARQARAHADLMGQFERRRVEKEYLAVVRGIPERDGGVIDLPLGSSRTSVVRLKMAVRSDGLPARTAWRVLRRARDRTLVSCRPHTGRQHQIRVHLDAIGHPLVGDKLYGCDEELFLRNTRGELTADDRAELGLDRHALHNHRLVFTSPRTGERREVSSPLPRDLADSLVATAMDRHEPRP